MHAPDLDSIFEAFGELGYSLWQGTLGHDLNIVGIRTDDNRSNAFNDWLTVFYRSPDKKTWIYFAFPATTDPGLYYRRNPLNVKGTAVVKPGQYRGVWKIGKHKGYKALQQKDNITVWRDNDRNETVDSGPEDNGIHAINLHRANPKKMSMQVDKWSAGCQVMADPDHFDFLMTLCQRGKEKYGNTFTYTLIDESDLR